MLEYDVLGMVSFLEFQLVLFGYHFALEDTVCIGHGIHDSLGHGFANVVGH